MEDIYKLYNVCSYEELVETIFNAWTITNDIDEGYADIGNVLKWLLDADLWTDKDRILMDSLSSNEIFELAIDIADMVREKLLMERSMERLDIEKQKQEIRENIREAQALYEYYYERGDLSNCVRISNDLGYYYDELNELNKEE